MSTMEKDAVTATLRTLARSQLALLTNTLGQLTASMDLPERLELSAWVGEGRRLLHGDEASPAQLEPPSNVRRLVAAGRRGPAFEAKEEAVVGRGGLRPGRYEDSVRPRTTAADCYASAGDEPDGAA